MEAAAIRTPVTDRSARLRAIASDEELVTRVRDGDDQAFEQLYDRYAGSLLAVCRHMLGNRGEAEDALQHTFVVAYRQLRDETPPDQFRPWLYAVARNRCLSMLRASRDTVALDDCADLAVGRADVARSVEQREEIREILDDVAALPDEQRAALLLAEVGALSHHEIAASLDVPKNKVKALVFQARRSLMGSRRARETSCDEIQQQLAVLRGGELRRTTIQRHLARCSACAEFRLQVRRQRSALAAALPVLPAVALKNSVLAAALAGGSGTAGVGGAAAALSAVTTAAAGSGAGAGGLASSALVTKMALALAVAGVAGGSIAAHELDRPDRAPAPRRAEPLARAASAIALAGGPAAPRTVASSSHRSGVEPVFATHPRRRVVHAPTAPPRSRPARAATAAPAASVTTVADRPEPPGGVTSTSDGQAVGKGASRRADGAKTSAAARPDHGPPSGRGAAPAPAGGQAKTPGPAPAHTVGRAETVAGQRPPAAEQHASASRPPAALSNAASQTGPPGGTPAAAPPVVPAAEPAVREPPAPSPSSASPPAPAAPHGPPPDVPGAGHAAG